MIFINKILLLIFGILFDNPQEIFHSTQNLKYEISEPVYLNEDYVYYSSVTDLCIFNNNLVIVQENTSSLIFSDFNGSFISESKRSGRGPFEWDRPTLCHIKKDVIYIWDSSQFKLSSFLIDQNFNLTPIREWNNLISQSISTFKIHDGLISFYMSGGTPGAIAEVYDLQTGRLYDDIGVKTEAHKLLMRNSGVGPMTINNSEIILSRTDKTDLYIYDTEKRNLVCINLDISGFTQTFVENAVDIVNTDRAKLAEIITTSDVVTRIHSLNDFIVIEMHIGIINYESANPFDDRKVKLLILDKENYAVIDNIELNIDQFLVSNLRASYANSILFFSESFDLELPTYNMQTLTFTPH